MDKNLGKEVVTDLAKSVGALVLLAISMEAIRRGKNKTLNEILGGRR